MKEGLNLGTVPTEDEATKIPANERGGQDLPQVDIESRPILSQEEGLNALHNFLQSEADFDSLGIFRLNTGTKNTTNKGYYNFYLGRHKDNKMQYGLAINPLHYLGYKPEQVFAVPKIASIGLRPYYWLEFREKLSDEEESSVFQSCRLQPDKQMSKIDSLHWRSLEEQLLVDFINGENGIKFTDLSPFKIKASNETYHLGTSANKLIISLKTKGFIKKGDGLVIVPSTDDQNKYYWIDILKKQEKGQASIKVLSYRILTDEKKISSIGWRNPEIQYLIDYISGSSEINFDNLRPIYISLPKNSHTVHLGDDQ